MQKKILKKIALLLAGVCVLSIALVSCKQKEYVVQYSNDAGIQKITVKKGEAYALEGIPEKFGYNFLGWFDKKTGGTQYVDENGSSISVFEGKSDLILYPQFQPKEYTVLLDYQGAFVSGERSLKVAYDSTIASLPMGVTLANKVFTGWYTEQDRQGAQVADEYGVLPQNGKVTENTFDLSSDSFTLYAGFEWVKYDVELHYGNNQSATLKVEYGEDIGKATAEIRSEEGEGVLTWTKTPNGDDIFTGEVKEGITLYAKEYAPYISFDTNGGEKLTSIISKAGSEIVLPTPKRENYKFIEWQDKNGNTYTETTMPASGITLKAVWQAKIVFDENGGTQVEDISTTAGANITLPVPEKEGFIFAGWYTAEKARYKSETMPIEGIALKAGWYTAVKKTITLVENNIDKKLVVDSNTLSVNKRLKIDLSSIFPTIDSEGVEITYTLNFRWGNTYKNCKGNGQIALYDGSDFNSSNQLCKKTLSHSDEYDSYIKESMRGVSIIHNNILYLYYAGKGDLHITLSGGYGDDIGFYDIHFELVYPDTSNLII